MREDFIQFHVRRALQSEGWILLAGQYPNGSDDHLPTLNVVDPAFARDESPEPRRHSLNKLVPDLVAVMRDRLLVIEMKPHYDREDEQKLITLMDDKRGEFDEALAKLLTISGSNLLSNHLNFIPCLAFDVISQYPTNERFCYLLVDESARVSLLSPSRLVQEFNNV